MTATVPDVSVVIITRDRRDELLATLDRLQALPERPPIIVVDNGSSDGTAAAAAAAGCDVIALSSNLGAEARNLGVDRASTALVAFSDDDSWWAPGALGRAAEVFAAHPRLGLLAARVLVGPAEDADPICDLMATSSLGASPSTRAGRPVLGFLACGAVVRRRAFQQAGGFPPGYGVGGEEAPLALSLAAWGWDLAYVPEVVAHHHPSPTRDPGARRRRVARNDLWTAGRLRSPASLARVTARMLAAASRDGAVRGGLLDAVRSVPAVLSQRRPVPAPVEAAARRLEQQPRKQKSGVSDSERG